MIPVQQTVLGEMGNCMAACWASILEVPIDDVPDYRGIEAAGGAWLNAINVWLTKHYGVLYYECEPWLTDAIMPRGFHLVNGDGGGASAGHACVGFMGRIVFDPHPRGTGLRTLDNYGLLVPLDEQLLDTWMPLWDRCVCRGCAAGKVTAAAGEVRG